MSKKKEKKITTAKINYRMDRIMSGYPPHKLIRAEIEKYKANYSLCEDCKTDVKISLLCDMCGGCFDCCQCVIDEHTQRMCT